MLGDVFSYLTDGANWSGSAGIAAFGIQQLLLTATALVIAVVVGLPPALYLGHRGWGGFLAVNVSNVGRAVPVFAVLLVLASAPGLGEVRTVRTGRARDPGRAGALRAPPIITNAYVAVVEVDRGVIEAARGMGMTEAKVSSSVQLPLAMPVVLTGIRLALVQVWATAHRRLVAGPGWDA